MGPFSSIRAPFGGSFLRYRNHRTVCEMDLDVDYVLSDVSEVLWGEVARAQCRNLQNELVVLQARPKRTGHLNSCLSERHGTVVTEAERAGYCAATSGLSFADSVEDANLQSCR